MKILEQLVEDAKIVIKKEAKDRLLILSQTVEEFLVRERVPILSTYSEDEFYKIEAYPDTNYVDIASMIRSELIPNLEKIRPGEYLFKPYIYNYLSYLSYDNTPILQLVNMYYPFKNTKYVQQSYTGKSRFSGGDVLFMHPKYLIETALYKKYDILTDKKKATLHCEELFRDWKRLDQEYSDVGKIRRLKPRYGETEYNMIKDKVVLCNHDLSHISCICSSGDLDKITNLFAAYDTGFNASKSLEDIRMMNFIVKKKDQIVLKIWILLDHEMIPVVKNKKGVIAAHIDVVAKIAFTDYLIYNILGSRVATIKLAIFKYHMKKIANWQQKHILIDSKKCHFVGTYYPNAIFLKQLRIDKIREMIEKNTK